MLRSINELLGYEIMAKDGEIGKVHDFFFNDEDWTIRYMVVDTGMWILGRKVLISPEVLMQPVWAAQTFPIKLTRDEVKNSPDLDLAKPVSRQHEEELRSYYHWPIYWGPTPAFPGGPMYVSPNLFKKEPNKHEHEHTGSSHLRSAKELTGYRVISKDKDNNEVGMIKDFIIDDENWQFRYMAIDTSGKLDSEKKILISLEWIREIDVVGKDVFIDLTSEAVKFSPMYDPATPVNRQFEEVLYDYHGKPKYWQVVEQ